MFLTVPFLLTSFVSDYGNRPPASLLFIYFSSHITLPGFVGSLSGTYFPLRCLSRRGSFNVKWRLLGKLADSVHLTVSQLLAMPLCSLFLPVRSDFLLLVRCSLQVNGKMKESAYFPATIDSSLTLHPKQQHCPQTLGKVAFRIISVLFPSQTPLSYQPTSNWAFYLTFNYAPRERTSYKSAVWTNIKYISR